MTNPDREKRSANPEASKKVINLDIVVSYYGDVDDKTGLSAYSPMKVTTEGGRTILTIPEDASLGGVKKFIENNLDLDERLEMGMVLSSVQEALAFAKDKDSSVVEDL